MKKISLITGLMFLFVLLTFTWSFAQIDVGKGCKHEMKMVEEEVIVKGKCGEHQEGMMHSAGCCKKGPEIGMKMCGMIGEDGEMGCCKREFFLCCKEELGLSDKQAEALKSIQMGFVKNKIKMEADLQIAHLELKALMHEDKAPLKEIEAKLRAVEKMKTDMKLAHLKAFREAREILTPEQKEKMKKCHQKM